MDIKLERYYHSRREPYIKSFNRIKLYKELRGILEDNRKDIENAYIKSGDNVFITTVSIKKLRGEFYLNDDVRCFITNILNNFLNDSMSFQLDVECYHSSSWDVFFRFLQIKEVK